MKEGRELLVGFVIVVAVLAAVVGTLWLQGSTFGRPTTTVQALIASVGQLTEGNAVTFRGVRIGTVDAIQVEPGGGSVRLSLLLRDDLELPGDAAVVLGPESLFGAWQAEIVSLRAYPRFPFFQIPSGTRTTGPDVRGPVLPGYALPEISRLTASAEQISDNVADLSERFEAAFNQETADNLANAITNLEVITQEVRLLVQTQREVAGSIIANADTTLTEIEVAARAARNTFERVDGILEDSQIDSLVAHVAAGAANLAIITEELADEDEGVSATLRRADSAFTSMNRVVARVESGEGSLGRLLTDTTLVLRAEDVLAQLELLLEDVRENPRRYVRLSIF